MEKIIDVFWGLILMGIIVILGISFAEADAAGQAARRYKEDVVSEIENSNFSDDVISSCIEQATENGYTLAVNKIVVDPKSYDQIAEVTLKYNYTIPILNLDEEKTVKGVAR
jgi:hypothetical protein